MLSIAHATRFVRCAHIFLLPGLCFIVLLARPASAQNSHNVSGMITFDSIIPNAVALQPITFNFASTTNPYSFTRTLNLNADGTYLLTNIPPDAYTVGIKGMKWLRVNVPVDTTAGDVSDVNATLLGGDANNDNSVDIADFGILVNAYNGDINIPGSGYDVRADFNCDGVVDIGDFGILVNQYNDAGHPLPTPPVVLSNLALSVSGVKAGGSLTGTLTLSGPAPTGGLDITLQSSDASVTVPSTVHIADNLTSATFSVVTDANAVTDPVFTTIYGTSGHWSQSASLTVVAQGLFADSAKFNRDTG